MIAAKAFDPVVGIDIHIIQPPGPVPPLPVPHPFIGILLDPFDFAPIIGSTVSVNGLPRATAGTGGRCLPPHIPIGGVFVKPPANECDVFMGSSTVLADDEPLSFLGMPALSCHCIGMPPFPRLKKKRSVKSLVLPTTFVIAIPMGMPVLVGGPPTVSMMALGMRAGMAALGKVFKKLRKLQKASRRMKAISDKIQNAAKKAMNKLGVPPSVQNRVSAAICTATGHPVDVATGKVFTRSVDFELPGPLPLRWERIWYSTSVYDGPVGWGWHHAYDMELLVAAETQVVVVRLSDGRSVAFPALADGGASFNRMEQLALRRRQDEYSLVDLAGCVYRFQALSRRGGRLLAAVEDPSGARIAFAYSPVGDLQSITDSAGRVIGVEVDESHRIVALNAPHPDHPEQTFGAVRYRYDECGDLVEMRDALGYARSFQYRNHLLVQETDRNGYSFHFEYDAEGPAARCIRTWGDGGLYARRLSYDLATSQTTVVDARGAAATYEWNGLGLVTRHADAAGGVSTTEWSDEARRLASVNAAGERTEYRYDDDGRLTARRNAAGGQDRLEYDGEGNLVAFTDAAGGRWTKTFDHRRHVIASSDPSGAQWGFDVNEQGFAAAVRDPLGRVTRFEWDGAGNLLARIDPDGGTLSMRHDALGRPVQQTDEHGRTTLLAWNLRGNLIGVKADGAPPQHLTCDGEGNVSSFHDGIGMRTYAYGPLGAVLAIRDPSGLVTRYRYDEEGALIGARDSLGSEWHVTRDVLGRMIEATDPYTRRRTFVYDSVGRMTAYRDAVGAPIEMAYHPGGRLKERRYPDGDVERFAYDAVGRLVTAENSICTVRCEHDAAGRLVAERSDFGAHTARYDLLGRLVERRSSGGVALRIDYGADDRLSGVRRGDIRLVDIVRSSRQVVHRYAGNVARTDGYDDAGRLRASRVESTGSTLLAREFAYDDVGRLIEARDSHLGAIRYERNDDGRLLRSVDADGFDAYAAPFDAAGTVAVPTTQAIDRNGKPGQLRFDPSGHLVEKRHETIWTYRYDHAGRLQEARDVAGRSVTFSYDALGRRIEKRAGTNVVRYAWFGELVWSESRRDAAGTVDNVENVWEPGGFRPIAAVSAGGATFFHCDDIGTPWGATDDRGRAVWSALLGASGIVRREQGDRNRVPFRFPGHAYDAETGLHYNRYRYYDPELCMYTVPDPIGLVGGITPYSYVPDPLTWTDPYGLAARRVCTKPDCPDCARPGDTLVRRGAGPETAESLAAQAKAAERAGFPHGVSVTTPAAHARRAPELGYDPDDASRATREAFEDAGFPVHHTPTKPDPQHHTVELPQDVTEEVAENFNSVLGRT